MSSFKLKILLTAGYAAGKTSLLLRFLKGTFYTNLKLTVGVDVRTKDIEFAPGKIATLSIWDVGAAPRMALIRTSFYKGAAGIMLVFDLTRSQTFEEMPEWLAEIRQFAGEDIPFVLIGNKADLIEDVGIVIDSNEARLFAEKEGGIYIETSARTGFNVQYAFEEITRRAINSKEIQVKERKEIEIEETEKKEKRVELEKRLSGIEKLLNEEMLPKIENIKAINKFIEEAEKYNLYDLINKVQETLILSIKGKITQKGILAFVSYSSKDSKVFKVKKIAEMLTSYKEIADVWYFEEDTREDFVAYMNKYIKNCDMMILFCSENAEKSYHVNAEWSAAFAMKKPIIPVFEEIDYIPPLLRSKVGIKFDQLDFQKNIHKLYEIILKNQ